MKLYRVCVQIDKMSWSSLKQTSYKKLNTYLPKQTTSGLPLKV